MEADRCPVFDEIGNKFPAPQPHNVLKLATDNSKKEYFKQEGSKKKSPLKFETLKIDFEEEYKKLMKESPELCQVNEESENESMLEFLYLEKQCGITKD